MNSKTVSAFDAKQAGIPRRQRSALEKMHEQFAEELGTSLVNYISLPAQVTFQDLKTCPYGLWQKSLSATSLFSLFEIESTDLHGLLRLDVPVVFMAIDRALGGSGKLPEAPRELSLIETKMAEALMERILAQLNGTWEVYGECRFTLKGNATMAGAFRFLSPDDTVLVFTFDVRLQDTQVVFQSIFPIAFLKPFMAAFDQSPHKTLGDLQDPSTATALRSRLEAIRVRLRTVLGEQKLSVKELSDLERGDVIRLQDLSNPLVVTAGGVPVFSGFPGTRNKKMVIRIDGPATSLIASEGDRS